MNTSKTLNTHLVQFSSILQKNIDEKKQDVKKGLLALTVAASILSLIPPIRLAGALTTRSVVLVSSSLECIKPHDQTLFTRITNYTKVAAVALGIVGLSIVSPSLIIASLIVDIGIQTFELGKAIYEKDVSILGFATCIAIDSLVIGAMLASSWQLMVAAATVSAIALGVMSLIASAQDKGLEAFCYLALSMVSCASAFTAAKLTQTKKTNSKFTIENSSDKEFPIYNKQGKLVATIPPKESASFEVPFRDTLQHRYFQVIPTGTNGTMSIVPSFEDHI